MTFRGVGYEFIDYEENMDDLIQVKVYGRHQFDDYYYSPENDLFYFDTGANLRKLHINFNKNGCAFVNARDKENKSVNIYFTKFKRLYKSLNLRGYI